MEIICGLKDNALLQRDENGFCKCCFSAKVNGKLNCSMGNVEQLKDGNYLLKNIKAGGPYDITLSDDNSSVSIKVWVGDLWLLAGQSNMEGAAEETQRDIYNKEHTNNNLRAYFCDDVWGDAVPRLHELWKAKEDCVGKEWIKERASSAWGKTDEVDFCYAKHFGVGPGYSFLKTLYEITGVPQGCIPCGIGGADMASWLGEYSFDYFDFLKRRFYECGGFVAGIYWDQGEADTSTENNLKFNQRIDSLIKRFRDLTQKITPIVIGQIFKVTLPWVMDKENHKNWSEIRQKQYELKDKYEKIDVVSSANSNLFDLIHKDSDSQYDIGHSAGISMANLCGYGGKPSIRLKKIKLTREEFCPFRYSIDVYFENIIGDLVSYGIPNGFSFALEGEEDPFLWPNMNIRKMELHGDFVRIRNEISYEKLLNARIWYLLSHNSFGTIMDSEKRYLPAFGPIKIKDYLGK